MKSGGWRLPLAVVLLVLNGAAAAGSIEDLLRAYRDRLAGADDRDLIWSDGTRMPIGESRPERSPQDRLRHGSILDQIGLRYPANTEVPSVPTDDPGRVRNRAFFDKMYGDCRAGDVAPRLANVVWLPRSWGHVVRITTVNGVNRQLEAISRELDDLPGSDHKYLYPLGGTYLCRAVADTGQPSMHGWGAAIDINPARSQYWLWRHSGGGPSDYVNSVPPEIVAVFERHGFIWGGRWVHFDTMHFEYRPELLGYDPHARE
jgi:hypothetical protein